ncbi:MULTISPECIES: YbhB/YbcL family Raf kinase inhibitor-like protein [unclassified Neisseria]|uniref:YbhB/YbcL family Raf kinase inhibitor-like protein n=1 Tax=unclassified Neisseria TaxID=2623750 RepID=UPI0026661685|nr:MULTISPECIES: YbhB/YbcL family Raf kinase inhibitor-like protein [unclassified Neisseria]MDO1509109.1 YbhB/YbcL family Raf kinase inhibitor-like protein [Neisseria sp. MVDL19-042950]MDO1516796.1 YbhB/YbcL family Raf kinase inhibitor-like protein [Neisseria sp. MVDL18-041461]MDO1563992.1 YbhB/YbcL family Raf kinase inhibitor-like protein [Neisseria sp. MVDL20-010259]
MYKKLFAAVIISLSSSAAFAAGAFTLKADDIKNGRFGSQQVLSEDYGFGCSGENLSPALSWKNAPKGTKSFVLTIYDKDAPTGLGWVHWVVANIPANVNKLPAGITADGKNLPAGALQTRTDFGNPGYGGACPPKGRKHRYEITLTALKIDKLPNVAPDSMPALVGFLTKANSLGSAKVTVVYQR